LRLSEEDKRLAGVVRRDPLPLVAKEASFSSVPLSGFSSFIRFFLLHPHWEIESGSDDRKNGSGDLEFVYCRSILEELKRNQL